MARGRRRREAAPSRDAQPELPTGMGYGERKAIEDAQAQISEPTGAGLARAPAGAPAQGRAGQAAVGPAQVQDPFGPTNRPMESLAGAAQMNSQAQPDADTILRVMYQKFPSPWIARLLRGG